MAAAAVEVSGGSDSRRRCLEEGLGSGQTRCAEGPALRRGGGPRRGGSQLLDPCPRWCTHLVNPLRSGTEAVAVRRRKAEAPSWTRNLK